jgi:DNA (cytosine-5)-methyltransferase 1
MSKIVPAMSKTVNFGSLREKAGLSCLEAAEKFSVTPKTIYRWENGESRPQPLAIKELKEMIDAAQNKIKMPSSFKFIDLFAGIGGFRRAFDSIGGKCVFTSEWDKSCRMTYAANYDCDHPVVGDIREFTKDEESLDKIPKHDVLLAGFPCQPFSIAGVSKKNSLGRAHGFRCDTQGTLFFDLAQIIEHHTPPVILLENVKNLLSHDSGKTFRIIKKTLEEELGYVIRYKVIDAKPWVPQHRERILIAGFRHDTGFTFDNLAVPEKDMWPKLDSILHKTKGLEEDEAPYLVDGKVGEKYTLTPRLWEYLQEYKAKHQALGNGFGFSEFGPDGVARTLSARYYKDGSEILIKQRGKRPRRLTPRECSRLMGFDGPGESNFKIVAADTPAYKQFGNSVVVPLIKTVAEHMKPHIFKVMEIVEEQLQIPFEETRRAKSA